MISAKFPRSSRVRCRGAASVEAVVVLPIFLVLFISLFYVRDQVLAKQAAQEQARTCAWLYSWNNCNAQGMPAECEGVVTDNPMLGEVPSEVTDALGGDSFFADIVAGMIEPVLEVAFGSSADAKVTRDVARPLLYGGETSTVVGKYHIACNLAPTTAPEVALDAWDRIKPF